jgi:mannitol/fructose-specific phosphotransferase system IIA component (Ntr-type)
VVLSSATVRVNVAASTWQEAIQAVGNLLVADGAAVDGIVDVMVRAVEAKGPYIVASPGIALPHAGPDHGKRVALGVVRLQTPVVFNHPSNDPVDLLFCLCCNDYSSHVGVLVKLTMLLENPTALQELRSAPDDEAALLLLLREI